MKITSYYSCQMHKFNTGSFIFVLREKFLLLIIQLTALCNKLQNLPIWISTWICANYISHISIELSPAVLRRALCDTLIYLNETLPGSLDLWKLRPGSMVGLRPRRTGDYKSHNLKYSEVTKETESDFDRGVWVYIASEIRFIPSRHSF